MSQYSNYSVTQHEQENKNVLQVLVGNPEGKIPLRRPRYRWKSNIKMEKLGGKVWAGFIWFRTGEVTGSCKHSNKS